MTSSQRNGWDVWEPCIICGLDQPQGEFHEFPWHITCDDDEEGAKKAKRWKADHKTEQRKQAKAAIPTLDLPEA